MPGRNPPHGRDSPAAVDILAEGNIFVVGELRVAALPEGRLEVRGRRWHPAARPEKTLENKAPNA